MLQGLEDIFANYQSSKLWIANPDLTNLLIGLLFLVFVFLTSEKGASRESTILNRRQSEQLRGLAIFLVVLGHLWKHVSDASAHLVFSPDAVAMFLLLSGFGLTSSSMRRSRSLRAFFLRRARRLFVPYWIATFAVLSLDYLILRETLSLGSVLMTLIGVNFKAELGDLDHARWFVTFLLLWYILFWLAHTVFREKGFVYCLFLIASVWFVMNYYFISFGYHYFAFPVGCTLALYRGRFQRFFERNRRAYLWGAFFVILGALSFRALDIRGIIYEVWPDAIPSILLKVIREGMGIMLCLAVIMLTLHIGKGAFHSRLLLFLGRHSYEIFLLHGVFLIKYNPIIKGSTSFIVAAEFAIFFVLIGVLSFLLSKSCALFARAKTAT